MFFNNNFYIASHRTAVTFLIWTSSLFFFFRLFDLSTRFISVTLLLTLKSSVIHWLTCFRVSSGLFLVLSWMLWMLVTVHELCHVPHASRITTCGTVFTERHFSVSKKWMRSWSHTLFGHKTFTKKLFGGPSRKSDEKEKKKKKKKTVLNAKAKMYLEK